MKIYKRLKDLREDNDLTQKEIADILKTTANYYGDYENGKREITLSRMIELANFYRVSLDYLTERTNDKKGLTKSELSAEDTQLIKKFHSLSEKRKERLLERLDVLLEQESEETAKLKEVE